MNSKCLKYSKWICHFNKYLLIVDSKRWRLDESSADASSVSNPKPENKQSRTESFDLLVKQ